MLQELKVKIVKSNQHGNNHKNNENCGNKFNQFQAATAQHEEEKKVPEQLNSSNINHIAALGLYVAELALYQATLGNCFRPGREPSKYHMGDQGENLAGEDNDVDSEDGNQRELFGGQPSALEVLQINALGRGAVIVGKIPAVIVKMRNRKNKMLAL